MQGALIAIITLASGIISQSPAIISVSEGLPARMPQDSITCHDATWEQKNLVGVSGFKFETKLAPFIEQAIADARTDGLSLQLSSTYRTCAEQQRLRISACGVGDYNLYQKPIDLCLPPTEPAGKSLHNEGLAVDFKCGGYGVFGSSPCVRWMRENGYKYHLYEHRLEPWHWSTTGQ